MFDVKFSANLAGFIQETGTSSYTTDLGRYYQYRERLDLPPIQGKTGPAFSGSVFVIETRFGLVNVFAKTDMFVIRTEEEAEAGD